MPSSTLLLAASLLLLLLLPSPAKAFLIRSDPSPRRCPDAALFARKPQSPRFTQTAHRKKRSFSVKKAPPKKPPTADEPWFNGKSIDDLESSMAKKWGAKKFGDASSMGDYEIYNADEEDDEDYIVIDDQDDEYDDDDDDGFILEEAAAPSQRRPTVRDPWMDDEDEEFEAITKSLLSGPPPTTPKKSTEETGYFFNPKAKAKASDEVLKKPEPRTKAAKAKLQQAVEEEQVEKKRSEAPRTVPIRDENGEPLLLTTDEALRQFHMGPNGAYDENSEVDINAFIGKTPSASSQWEDLGITSEILLENLNDMDCSSPLAVQDKSCEPILDINNDVLVGTYTGSGKTLAFLVPLVQRLLREYENEDGSLSIFDDDEEDAPANQQKKKAKFHNGNVAILIVAPGRELASQIASVARELVDGVPGLLVQLAIGGTTVSRNVEQIRKKRPAIVVGTPGRIAELIIGKPGEKSGKMKVSTLQTLVMDEFDALLQYKAHREPTEAIMQSLKKQRRDSLQSVLCSATAVDMVDSPRIKSFLRPGYITAMADPDDVLVTQSTDAKMTRVSRTVLHGAIHASHSRLALETVRKILHTQPTPQQILIFVENSHKVEIIVKKLAEMDIVAAPLHGGRGSDKMDRAEVSKALREGYVGIVVATELAARGLDAPLLTHVINLDLPTDASHYAHRAGRCGRGGRPGVVINLTTSYKDRNVPQRFATQLGVKMHSVEPRSGKLMIVEKAEVSPESSS